MLLNKAYGQYRKPECSLLLRNMLGIFIKVLRIASKVPLPLTEQVCDTTISQQVRLLVKIIRNKN